MPRELVSNIEPALREGAGEIAAMARRLVPVRTGRLQKSIVATPGSHELEWLVIAGNERAFYAGIIERSRRGQPFLQPSYRALSRRVKSRISRAAKRAIKEATQRN
jgi:hypothetical protein